LAVHGVRTGAEHNTTIVFPLPIDLIASVTQTLNGAKKHRTGGCLGANSWLQAPRDPTP